MQPDPCNVQVVRLDLPSIYIELQRGVTGTALRLTGAPGGGLSRQPSLPAYPSCSMISRRILAARRDVMPEGS